MNWKAIWTTIRTNPILVAFWTAFVGALGEQFLRLASSGSFDWSGKNIVEMASAAATTAIIALIHLYTQPSPPAALNLSSKVPLVLLFLILPMMGCATASTNPPTAPAVTALNILNEVQSDVAALQQAESSAYTAGLIDAPTNAAIQKALAQEAVDATALSQAIASTTSTTATVQQKVDALIADMQTDSANGVAGIKDAKTKATIIASLAATEIVVNGIMAAYGGK